MSSRLAKVANFIGAAVASAVVWSRRLVARPVTPRPFGAGDWR